jgi:hypothetical protein
MLTMFALLLAAQSGTVAPTGSTFGAHLLIADGDGTVRAWTQRDLALDEAFTKKLNGDGLLAIIRDQDVLWGFDGTRVFIWDAVTAGWDRQPSKPPKVPCQAFAVVDGKPVGICGPGVHRFSDGKYWDAPEFKDQLTGRGFGEDPKAIAVHGTQLAIGTGFGEWGGYLWLLDVANGEWGKHYDPLGNALGIAWNGKGWAVAWSMSHFTAHTRVRLHGTDGKALAEGAELKDKYLRKLAFDEETKTLYGLEQNDLVKIGDKFLLNKVQSVGKVKYGEERNAVGVSSGISQLLPLGGGRLLLVPKSGEPLVVSAGKVTPLKAK